MSKKTIMLELTPQECSIMATAFMVARQFILQHPETDQEVLTIMQRIIARAIVQVEPLAREEWERYDRR